VTVHALAFTGAVAGQAALFIVPGKPPFVEPVPAVELLPPALAPPDESSSLSVEPPQAMSDARLRASRPVIPYLRAFMTFSVGRSGSGAQAYERLCSEVTRRFDRKAAISASLCG